MNLVFDSCGEFPRGIGRVFSCIRGFVGEDNRSLFQDYLMCPEKGICYLTLDQIKRAVHFPLIQYQMELA